MKMPSSRRDICARFSLEKLMFLFPRSQKSRDGALGCLSLQTQCLPLDFQWVPMELLFWETKHPKLLFCVHKNIVAFA